MATRLKKLQGLLKQRKLDGIVVSHMPDIRYLCGFSGSAGTLFVSRKNAWFLTDGRYAVQATEELPGNVEVIIDRAHLQRLRNEKIVAKGMTIGFQDHYISVAALERMKRAFKKKVALEPVGSFLRSLTMVKTEEEVAHVRKAASIAARVYREILKMVKPGMRENEVAMEISYLGRKFGSEGDAFDIIVASGHRSALPHGRASTKKIAKGDLVTLDFGCIWNGFNSDMTRTFAVGEPGTEAREIYNVVYQAEREGVKRAQAGMQARELDAVCRDIIEEAGYGDAFTHSTGHGLGLEVHESPGVAKTSPKEMVLKEGMIVTIEPGIYLPEKFGVRIEDDVLIQKDGCRELTSASRKLTVL